MCTEIDRLLLEMSASHMLTLGRCNSSRFDHKSERRMNCSIILQADGLTSLSKNTIYKNKQETLQSELKFGMKNLESSIFYEMSNYSFPLFQLQTRKQNIGTWSDEHSDATYHHVQLRKQTSAANSTKWRHISIFQRLNKTLIQLTWFTCEWPVKESRDATTRGRCDEYLNLCYLVTRAAISQYRRQVWLD